jgi:hypothetical protein
MQAVVVEEHTQIRVRRVLAAPVVVVMVEQMIKMVVRQQ